MKWPAPVTDLPLIDFGIALLIGALVGIDRERKKANEQLDAVGGLRTFILFAEAGAISAWLAVQLNSVWLFALMGLVVGGVVLASYLSVTLARNDAFGVTTEVAAIVVFLLGGLVIFGFRDLAVILAVATSALLAYKRPLHGMVAKLSEEDVFSGVKLLIATFIVLPILPNRPLDPWGAVNPYEMWWLVILISSLSLAGYVATRWLGAHRGTALTGLFGGLASSTAVTLAMSRQSITSTTPASANVLAAGLLIAWAVMFIRVTIEVAVVNYALLWSIIVPIATMGVLVATTSLFFYLWGRKTADIAAEEVPLTNPFSLTSALKFALFFVAVQLVVKLVQTYLSPRSFYAVAALAGLSDVDAITLSMAEYAKKGDAQIAATSIVIAAVTNSLVKCGLVVILGSVILRWRVITATALLVVGGLVTIFVPPLKPMQIPDLKPPKQQSEEEAPSSAFRESRSTAKTRGTQSMRIFAYFEPLRY